MEIDAQFCSGRCGKLDCLNCYHPKVLHLTVATVEAPTLKTTIYVQDICPNPW